MTESFRIPVAYKGKEIIFPAKLLVYEWGYQIKVEVYGIEVVYEPDEEKNFRAIIVADQPVEATIDKELLKAIAQVIEQRMNSC